MVVAEGPLVVGVFEGAFGALGDESVGLGDGVLVFGNGSSSGCMVVEVDEEYDVVVICIWSSMVMMVQRLKRGKCDGLFHDQNLRVVRTGFVSEASDA
ncbi:hypothetical protein Tco_0398091 [Tanacetum coccineum]